MTDAGNSDLLIRDVGMLYQGSVVFEGVERRLRAVNRRLALLRASALFSALAAEAYANEFLSAALPPADAKAVDRLSTPDKLLLGPALATRTPPLTRGREPFQTVARLFKVRNELVHAKPSGGVASHAADLSVTDDAKVGPAAVGQYLLAVAQAMELLQPLLDSPFATEGVYLVRHPEVIDEHIASTGSTISALPSATCVGIRNLLDQAEDRALAPAEPHSDAGSAAGSVPGGPDQASSGE